MGIEMNGKVALVTGGARGMGLGIVEQFLSAKAKVAISDISEEELQQTVSDLKKRFGAGNVHGIVANVSLEEDVKKMVTDTILKFGTVDILVNNAGIGTMKLFWDLPVEEWDRVFNVNVRGTFLCTKEVVKVMLEKDIKGRIVNISSINDHLPTTGHSPYCASKAAISMFTRVAALELGQHGINVNAIAPGFTMTPLTEGLFSLPNFQEAALSHTPKNRYAETEDIAKVALFLVSPYADWVTGQIINVDGGVSLMGLPLYYDELKKAGVI